MANRIQRSQSIASTTSEDSSSSSSTSTTDPLAAFRYARQAEKLSLNQPDKDGNGEGIAVEAQYITPNDPIIITSDGNRLPGVPLAEAQTLNSLRDDLRAAPDNTIEETRSGNSSRSGSQNGKRIQKTGEGSLRKAMPPSRTSPLFPPMPLYGPSSIMRDIQCYTFRTTSFFLSMAFLGIIVLGSAFTSIPLMLRHIGYRLTFRDPCAHRPFYTEEILRERTRIETERAWKRKNSRRRSKTKMFEDNESGAAQGEFMPTEGGPDPLICDVAYYARRVGLDMEELEVQTEDGFIITLWHIYNPLESTPMSKEERSHRGPEIFTEKGPSRSRNGSSRKPKFPILLIHGLLQSAGAYCSNDDSSLAFYLCKAGYDVWLGNNRCGFKPKHTVLDYSDPRMWAWNIRQMGVMDLPALTSRVLSETGFSKLGLIAHSQGTTETFVALAKEQRPELGDKLTVFCALAPAAYAGPLIGKAYFKFMRVITPAMFRIIFGIHAFIPIMMTAQNYLPGRLYGAMGYRVFSFLFNWTDDRWDRGLRDRMFRFAPVYVSAESMRWWLGRECFAKQKCILATREETYQENEEDEMEDYYHRNVEKGEHDKERPTGFRRSSEFKRKHDKKPKGSTAWYNEKVPPFALWIAGSDDLVDGRRLLRRFERGREPYARIVHSKVIEEYEHLDVIWAMDSVEKVADEIKEVLWKTCDVRDKVRVPHGCEDIAAWNDPKFQKERENSEKGSEEMKEEETEGQSSSTEEKS